MQFCDAVRIGRQLQRQHSHREQLIITHAFPAQTDEFFTCEAKRAEIFSEVFVDQIVAEAFQPGWDGCMGCEDVAGTHDLFGFVKAQAVFLHCQADPFQR